MNRLALASMATVAGALAIWGGWRLGRAHNAVVATRALASIPTVAPPARTTTYEAAAAPEYDARRDRSLEDILSAIEAARLDPVTQATVDDRVSGDLFAVLESLTAEEIPMVLEHLSALPPPSPDRLLAAVLGRWARQDGAVAMTWADKLTPVRREHVRGAILSAWASHDPVAAWQWYRQARDASPEPRHKLEQDFSKMIHAWAQRDAPAALEACLEAGKHDTYDKWYGFTSLVARPEHRDTLLTLIAGIEDEKERTSAHRSALGQWSASAPAEAAAWLDANLPDADGNLVWAVAERFGRANPQANANWLLQRTPPDQRDEAFRLCLHQWSEIAPDDAAAWLESAGPTDLSAQILASRFARSDLEKAMTWARRVSPENRAETVANTLAQAQIDGQNPDIAKFAGDAGLTTEALATKVESARQILNSRR